MQRKWQIQPAAATWTHHPITRLPHSETSDIQVGLTLSLTFSLSLPTRCFHEDDLCLLANQLTDQLVSC